MYKTENEHKKQGLRNTEKPLFHMLFCITYSMQYI